MLDKQGENRYNHKQSAFEKDNRKEYRMENKRGYN